MVELRLHASLYDRAEVQRLLPLYQGLARIGIEEGEEELRLSFAEIDPEVADTLVDHFANHALAQTVRARAQALETMTGSSP